MKIVLIPHLKIRLKERKIPKDYPETIIQDPEEKYKDADTGYNIVIKRVEYNGKLRLMAVVYDIIESEIKAITVYPTSRKEIENKLKGGRWIYEDD